MVVTSHDVARRAGVSQPTVSKALRDQRGVSAATRQRVREAARELGYVPSQRGRALATRRTRRIGVVASELANPFYPALIGPIHDTLSEAGYHTILLTDDASEVDLEPILDGSLDGAVLTTCTLDSTIPAELAGRGIPFCLVNRETRATPGDVCVPDNVAGASQVADLLADLGHQRIGVISGPANTSTGSGRLAAFRDQLARRGTALHPERVIESEFSIEAGRRGLERLLRAADPPTAVFCANDVIAVGALNHARAAGIRVPEELSVVGFDDIALSGWELTGLTTVRVEHEVLARSGVDQLLSRIEDADLPIRRTVVPAELVLRGSHAAPA